MTNIKYIRRSRHHSKNRGGGSSENSGREKKAYYRNSILDMLALSKRKDEFGYNKWNQLNFK